MKQSIHSQDHKNAARTGDANCQNVHCLQQYPQNKQTHTLNNIIWIKKYLSFIYIYVCVYSIVLYSK